VLVHLTPDAFVGVEFGGIGRKAFQMKAGIPTAQVPDWVPLVRFAVVPDDDDVAA